MVLQLKYIFLVKEEMGLKRLIQVKFLIILTQNGSSCTLINPNKWHKLSNLVIYMGHEPYVRTRLELKKQVK